MLFAMKKVLFIAGAVAYMLAFGMETAHTQQACANDASQDAATVIWSVGGGFLFDDGRIGGARGEFEDIEQRREWSSALYNASFGAWGFVDATFAELSVSFLAGIPSWDRGTPFTDNRIYRGSFFAFDLSLLGRLPFALGESGISIFPLLGIGYSIVFSATLDDGSFWEWGEGDWPIVRSEEPMDPEGSASFNPFHLGNFKIIAGVGGDFALSEKVFLRTSVLGSYRVAARHFRNMADNADVSGGFGITIKLGVGFRL